jgi:3-dehydroquinate synthase
MHDFQVNLPPAVTEVKFFGNKKHITEELNAAKLLFVSDSNTQGFLGDIDFPSYVIPPGENYKSRQTVEKLSAWALREGAGRDAVFVAVGGGVVCDLTAFTASIYMRGVPVILVPTSLLSMVDASIGGKTGINFAGYKNVLGTFYPAREVRIVPEVLKSLSEREYFSGLAEVIKHALLQEGDLIKLIVEQREEIIRRNPAVLEELIRQSLLVKKSYIEEDPLEKGIRGHLNLGHTFAHALESSGNFSKWTHGEAVAWGIHKAMETGLLMGLTEPSYAGRVEKILRDFGYELDIPGLNSKDLLRIMQQDKKKREGRVLFVLQKSHGTTFFSEVPEEILKQVLS